MDFTKLKDFTTECDNKIIAISEKHSIGFKLLKQLKLKILINFS